MGRNTATINWIIGSGLKNTFNMYLFGSGILTALNFLFGLVETQSLTGAVQVAIDYYISKLTPFPLNEFLTADGFAGVVVNVALAVGIGLAVGGYRYWKNTY
jgi:hypothetical protein